MHCDPGTYGYLQTGELLRHAGSPGWEGVWRGIRKSSSRRSAIPCLESYAWCYCAAAVRTRLSVRLSSLGYSFLP